MEKTTSKPLTSFDTRWGTITSITFPGKVDDLNDLYDFRLLVQRMPEKSHMDLYFQVKLNRKALKEEKHPVQMLRSIYGSLMAHLRSSQFIKRYGQVVPRPPREGKMDEERRLNIELDRIFIREPAQMTFISDLSSHRGHDMPKGMVTVVARLPRGFTIKLLPVEVQQDIKSANGQVVALDRLFTFYVNRPPMTEAGLISEDVLKRAFRDKMVETFPFLHFDNLNLQFREVMPPLVPFLGE